MRCFLTTLFAVFFLFEMNGQAPPSPPGGGELQSQTTIKIWPSGECVTPPPGGRGGLRESAILATGGYLLIHGKLLEKKLDGLSVAQLDAVLAQPKKLSFAEKNYSASARKWSNYLLVPGFRHGGDLVFHGGKNAPRFFQKQPCFGRNGAAFARFGDDGKEYFQKKSAFYLQRCRAPF